MNLSSLATPLSAGEADQVRLEVDLVFGESTATAVWASGPLKVLVPRSRGTSVWAYTSSFGGGLVAGDETRLEVRLGQRTRCLVATQSSTRIYRNPNSIPCGHLTRAELGEGSLLVFAPDPVQPFADSSYTQQQEFRLAPDAGLVLVDWFNAGRTARGERWNFKRYESRNIVFANGGRVFMDGLVLDAAEGDLAAAHRMDRFNCFATVLFAGPSLGSASAQLLETVSARPVSRRGAVVCSASPVRNGAVLRVAGEAVESVGRELHRHLDFLCDLLGDDPWSRKW